MPHKLKPFIISLLIVATFGATHSFAATMFLVPEQKTVGLQDKIIVNVLVDSEGVGFNTSQATIRFPKNLFTVKEPDTSNSAFSFWLEQPKISNDQGVITFLGGAPYGVSGKSIQILRLEFTPKGIGSGNISIVDAAITSSDGSGANIASGTVDTTVVVSSSKTVSTQTASEVSTTATTSVTVTKPVEASGLPALPKVNLPLYPDASSWSNSISPFTASWSLPSDVTGVNTVLNHEPKFIPNEKSKGLFDSESFNALTDGTWYLHVRFENSKGWGPTLHRKIAVDTVPPSSFKTTQSEITDPTYPSATLKFRTTDALSGLSGYIVRIDGIDQPIIPPVNFSGKFTTPNLLPGNHNVQIQATDLAGNSVISTSSIRIEPIASPIITSYPSTLYIQDNSSVTLNGTGLANQNVVIDIRKGAILIEHGTSTVNAQGVWTFNSKKTLPSGTFTAHVRNQDSRGALSNDVVSGEISVEDRPVIQLGIFHLGLEGAVIALLTILFGGMFAGWWLYSRRQDLIFRRLLSTEADISKAFAMVHTDLELITKKTKVDNEIKLIADRIDANVEKMERYIKAEIQNVNK